MQEEIDIIFYSIITDNTGVRWLVPVNNLGEELVGYLSERLN